MEASLKLKLISSEQLTGVGLIFFLLLSVQLHLLLALPENSMVAAVVELGGKHKINGVGRHGGSAVGGHGGGGEHGSGSTGDGGADTNDNGQGGGVIPVYAAGANHNRDHQHHGSSNGTVNCTAWSCLVLILFTYFFFAYTV